MLVIAHRGARDRAPENTIEAFEAALDDGADGIEFDVRVTADEVAVVCHDEHLGRVAGVDAWVSRMRFDELRAIDVSRACPGWTRPASIPALEQVLERLAGRIPLYAELKPVLDPAIGYRPSAVAAHASWPLLAEVPRLVVSSFDASGPAMIAARSEGRIPIAHSVIAASAATPFVEDAVRAGAAQLHLEASMIDATLVARARAAGLDVLAFTVDDRDEARRLEAFGVAGVFSDSPGALRRGLGREEHA